MLLLMLIVSIADTQVPLYLLIVTSLEKSYSVRPLSVTIHRGQYYGHYEPWTNKPNGPYVLSDLVF